MARADVAVVILTRNEEENIPFVLASVEGWARECYVVDSFSTDRTCEVASGFDCTVRQHAFETYSAQRNWALDHLPFHATWILFLDADEWIPNELKEEIREVIEADPPEAGFLIKRRLIWMGRWIRRGYYPTWILRLFRRGLGRYEDRIVNEHPIVDGQVGYLKQDFIHEDRRGMDEWVDKHNRYATMEAIELTRSDSGGRIPVEFWGSQAERKRWLRRHIYERLPLMVRPFIFFFYRYVLRGGFLDGKEALIYHFMQALWFHCLVDAKYLELKMKALRPEPVSLGREVRKS